jgi:hypothetical protein
MNSYSYSPRELQSEVPQIQELVESTEPIV